MIKNERQYRITKGQITKYQKALVELGARPKREVHPLLWKAQQDALHSQLDDLRAEADEYKALQAGKRRVLKLDSLDQLPQALIRARIARGLTQKQLAQKIGVQEQQIQRYEASDYATASFGRLKEIIRALNIKVREWVLLDRPAD